MFKLIYQLSQKLLTILNQHKFKAFSAENLKIIHNYLNYFKNKESRFVQISFMINDTGQSLKTALTVESQSQNISILSKVLVALKSTKVNQHKHHDLCYQLNSPLFWSENFKAATDELNNKIAVTYQKWQEHGKYAEYSTPDLIFVYKNVFFGLNMWLSEAKKEFVKKGSKLPAVYFNEYKYLLNKLEVELIREKQIARASLIARLETGIKASDLRYDDTAQATVKELQELKVLPNDVIIKTQGIHKHLTPSGLKKIRYIINCEGTDTEKTCLKSLLHVSNNLTARVNKKGYVFSIPTSVNNLIAYKPPFYTKLPRLLHRFFSDSKISYELFQNDICQYLLVSHESLTRLPVTDTLTLSTLAASPIWQNLQYHFYLLRNEEARIESIVGRLGILHSNTQKVIAAYKRNLQAIGQAIVQKQTALLLNLVAALEASPSSLNTAHLQQLIKLRDLCEINSTKYQYNGYEATNLLIRITMLLTPNKMVLVGDATFYEATKVTANLAAGVAVTNNDLSIVERATDALPASSKFFNDTQVSFILNKRLAEQKIPNLLQEELKKSPLTMRSQQVIEHRQKLTRLIEAIHSQKQTLVPSEKLQHALYQYIFRLLTEISEIIKPAIFNKQTGVITFVVDTLRKLTKDDAVFHNLLDKIMKFEEQYKLFDWNDFLAIYVKPLVENLKDNFEILKLKLDSNNDSLKAESSNLKVKKLALN